MFDTIFVICVMSEHVRTRLPMLLGGRRTASVNFFELRFPMGCLRSMRAKKLHCRWKLNLRYFFEHLGTANARSKFSEEPGCVIWGDLCTYSSRPQLPTFLVLAVYSPPQCEGSRRLVVSRCSVVTQGGIARGSAHQLWKGRASKNLNQINCCMTMRIAGSDLVADLFTPSFQTSDEQAHSVVLRVPWASNSVAADSVKHVELQFFRFLSVSPQCGPSTSFRKAFVTASV